MIAVRITAKRFADTQVLADCAFTLAPGETLAITGPSGIGKSTLLRILAGLDTRFEGSVTRPERIGIVFQEPTLLPWRNARDNITLVTGVDADRAEAVMRRVGLAGTSALFPHQLSLGQQRRLALARAFAQRPDLLLLDEPFVSLDPALVEDMMALTETLLRDRPIATVLVTHSEAEAARLATRRARLEGRPARLIEG